MAKHDATIFYAVIESHLSCLDEVLKCGKSDVIEIVLELIGILEISKYDDCIKSKAFLKENFIPIKESGQLSFLEKDEEEKETIAQATKPKLEAAPTKGNSKQEEGLRS